MTAPCASKPGKIRTRVVNDTALDRRVTCQAIEAMQCLQLLGTASSARLALEKLTRWQPDLMTLDMQMPELNGLEVLETISHWPRRPLVIVLSAWTPKGSELTLLALELGAFDFVTKPESNGLESSDEQFRNVLSPMFGEIARQALGHKPVAPRRQMPLQLLILQYMPPLFTEALAESLQRKCRIAVEHAMSGALAQHGTAYLAAGGRQMKLMDSPAGILIVLTDDPPEHLCRPSVDYLFRSAALHFAGASIGVVLTGMGSDGAEGTRLLKKSGAVTIAQDDASSIVFGMPREPIATGAVDEVLALDSIAERLVALASRPGGRI